MLKLNRPPLYRSARWVGLPIWVKFRALEHPRIGLGHHRHGLSAYCILNNANPSFHGTNLGTSKSLRLQVLVRNFSLCFFCRILNLEKLSTVLTRFYSIQLPDLSSLRINSNVTRWTIRPVTGTRQNYLGQRHCMVAGGFAGHSLCGTSNPFRPWPPSTIYQYVKMGIHIISTKIMAF